MAIIFEIFEIFGARENGESFFQKKKENMRKKCSHSLISVAKM